MRARDLANPTKAEQKLIAHLQSRRAGPCDISGELPHSASGSDLHLRTSLLQALALGFVEDVPIPHRGIEIHGAYILGDGAAGGETLGLDLEGTDVPRNLEFVSCYFPDSVVLDNAKTRDLSFYQCDLAGGLDANQIEVKGGLYLCRSTIAGPVQLIGARISNCLELTGSTLLETDNALICDRAEIDENLVLDGLVAEGAIRLSGARIGGDLDCEGIRLNAQGESMSAIHTIVKGRLLWRKDARARGTLNLVAAEFGSISDDPVCFPPGLLLDRCRYGGFVGKGVTAIDRINWLSRMTPDHAGGEFWPQPYEECARALRDAGHASDARAVLIRKERLQRAARRHQLDEARKKTRKLRDAALTDLGFRPFNDKVLGLTWQIFVLWLWDHLLGAVVDYGRRPGKAALWLGLVLLIGWFVFARAAGFGEIKPNLPQIQRAAEWTGCRPPEGSVPAGERWEEGDSQVACFLRQPEAASYPRFDALIYSADTLLPIVSLEMQSYWIPDDRKPLGWWARLYLWLHIFSGWGLTLLAVAGFSGLIKTDNSK